MKSFTKSLFLLLGFVLLIAAKSDNINKHTQHPLVGTSYSFVFEDLDGNEVNLDEMYDKTIFLNFWASWCKPCLKEMPSIKKAHHQLKDTNYEFVLVSDDNPMKIVNFQRKYKYPFMHLYSPVSKTELGVDVLPHTYVIKNGMILAVYEGTYDWSAKTYIDQLRDMAH